MRIYSMVLCLLLGGSTAAMAQESAAIGIKGGVNFANVTFEADGADVSFDRRTGFVGGLFLVWPATSRVALQVEGLYSQMGAELSEGGETGKVKLDYFTVPVMLRLSSSPSGPAGFHVFGGPSVGFRVRARSSGSLDGETMDEDISDEVEGTDIGVTAGAGIDIGRITIDGRHTWGLSNINKVDADELKIKNRVFAVMVGIRF